MFELAVRIASLCLALAAAETLHGIARIRFVVPRIGKVRAQRLSVVTGSILAFLVCFYLVPTLGLTRRPHLIALGFVLAVFMASFDILVSRTLAKRPWGAILEDFNPSRGNFLLFGVILIVFYPSLVMALAEAGFHPRAPASS
ncbi:MAG: hypothetical protein ABI584_00225 [Acidobacteriota bacterium]